MKNLTPYGSGRRGAGNSLEKVVEELQDLRDREADTLDSRMRGPKWDRHALVMEALFRLKKAMVMG